jgi:type I restriction enzyme S subunit
MKWETAKLEDIATIIDGDRGKNYPKQQEFFDKGYCLFLNTGNVTKDGFRFESNQFISEEKDSKLRKGKLQRGDIVYTTRGTVGNVGYYSERIPFNNIRINSGMVILRVRPDVADVQFIYQLLKSTYQKNRIKSYITGSAQPQLPIKNLSKILIQLPPIETQRRIADILSAYDDLIENNQKQIKLLEEAAMRLYKEWFVNLRFPGYETTKIVDGVPKGWERYKFSEKVSIMSGGTPKTSVSSYYGGNIPFYTPKDHDGFYFAYDTATRITDKGLENCNSKLYPEGTIVITARGTVGKTAIMAVPMAINQSCYALRCDELDSPYYLFFSLNEEVRKLKAMANGGVFDTIIVKTFDNIHILFPKIEVIRQFEDMIIPIMKQIQKKMKQLHLLRQARDKLLPRLMSGEIEV